MSLRNFIWIHVIFLVTFGLIMWIAIQRLESLDRVRYEEPVPVVYPNEEEIECLALNVYFEARNQSTKGKEAVAWVTLNRVESRHYPDTVCEVVWEDRQFSWTHDGKSDVPRNKEKWEEAIRIALIVYYFHKVGHWEFDPTSGAIMFHATYVEPYWAEEYAYLDTIGEHSFYK